MKLRPFALLSTSILNRTNRLLAEALEEWRTAWGLDMLDIRVECVRAWDAEPAQPALPWQRCYAQGQKSVWIAWQPEFFRYVQRHLFPPDQRHVLRPGGEISLASEGAEKATLAFSERVAGAAGLAVTDAHGTHIPPSAVFDRGSGGQHGVRRSPPFALDKHLRRRKCRPRFGGHVVAIGADDNRGAGASRRPQGRQHMRQQGASGDKVQHLRSRRAHARAFAGSQHNGKTGSHDRHFSLRLGSS